jgi:TRAP-type C4-dicarboxylate transport system substrate-binding protein
MAALGLFAIVLSGCTTSTQNAVGVDKLTLATIGAISPSQQAFIDRMNELSEGSLDLTVDDEWQPSGGGDDAEVALTKAVLAGDVDMAWVTIRSLREIGVTDIDALEAPLLIQTHEQQKAVATGVPGELIVDQLRNLGVEGLAVLPGPEQYPLSAGTPLVAAADWAGKTVEYGPENKDSAAKLTIEALGGTAQAGTNAAADVLAGTVPAATGNPTDFQGEAGSAVGAVMTANVALWPQMSIVIINRDVLDRMSTRQHGFLEGAVVRAQDIAMGVPDVATQVATSCAAGALYTYATADQLAALLTAVKPVYDTLAADKGEAKLLAAVQDVVKRNAGSGALSAACVYTPPPV